jgi:hypothetical protein
MNNLYQSNNLCLKYSLDGTPCPSVTASLAASQSAISQQPFPKALPKSRSGIYLAFSIQMEAKNIINNKQLLEAKKGNQKNQKSLLDNIELQKALLTWATSLQVPGHVGCSVLFL